VAGEERSPRARSRDVVALAVRAAEAYGRPDLIPPLRARIDALDGDDVRVAVVGGYKHGKSTLVNALAGVALCPVDDVTATAVPTMVRRGATAAAAVLHPDGEGVGRRALDLDAVGAAVAEPGLAGALGVEVTSPDADLPDGLVLIDTPGSAPRWPSAWPRR
jgi:ribosome biogenesis GTPase A